MMKTSLTRVAVTFSVLLLIVIGAFSAPNAKMGKVKQPVEVVQNCSTIDDATLTANVTAKISQTPSLTGQNVKAAAHNGVVTLTGNVSASNKKQIVQKVAASVQCVKRVVNRLIVTGPLHGETVCCCDGTCWIQSGRCPICDRVKHCNDDYKAAMAKAGKDTNAQAKAKQDFLACTCKEAE
jgi:hypothetical protein